MQRARAPKERVCLNHETLEKAERLKGRKRRFLHQKKLIHLVGTKQAAPKAQFPPRGKGTERPCDEKGLTAKEKNHLRPPGSRVPRRAGWDTKGDGVCKNEGFEKRGKKRGRLSPEKKISSSVA